MVRTYKKKRSQTSDPETLRLALEHFISTSVGYKKTAKLFGIPPSTLHGYINKYKSLPQSEQTTSHLSYGYKKPRQIFTDHQEVTLVSYLKSASSIYFGLSPRDVRVLAYECAKRFEIRMPSSWSDVQMAGPDWFSAFLKRHPDLSIRTPEATSLARATAFNRINVGQFFEKLGDVMERYQFDVTRIWNVDETGIVTVVKPNKIVAATGVKQVGSLTSAERGQLVTLCAAVSAAGQAIPPFLIYPRVCFKGHFLNGAPPGSDGSAYPSGWMTIENFLLFLKHFVQHVKPTTDRPVLMLLDNHESHLAIEALDYAKDNGITMLSFPPHCSHRLQPLDISVFGPLKKKLSQAQSNWLRSNPGKPISIYEIASILCAPWKEALTMTNICSGFRKAGIFPFNDETFSDSDFVPADVTDRPYEEPTAPNDDPGQAAVSVVPMIETTDESCATINSYLKENNISAIPVRGDGHCLMYAVCASLDATRQGTYTVDELGHLLGKEVAEYREFYHDFVATNDLDLTEAVRAFLSEKEYNNNSCDILLNAMCNALNMKAVVIRMCDAVVRQIEIVPGRLGVEMRRTIHLILHGSGFGAHYNGAVCGNIHIDALNGAKSPQPRNSAPELVEPVNSNPASTPNTNTESSGAFSPEVVKPHPKAPQRKAKTTNRKRRKTCVLTDTPEKEALREEQENRRRKQSKASKQNIKKGIATKRKLAGKSAKQDATDSKGEEDFCLVCLEPWSNSKSNEKWIQCTGCKLWSHEECADTHGRFTYRCHNCDSDDE